MLFDIDLNLENDKDMGPVYTAFCAKLKDVLCENTDVFRDDRATPSKMFVVTKPQGTRKQGDDGVY
jgi:hypothetical protein